MAWTRRTTARFGTLCAQVLLSTFAGLLLGCQNTADMTPQTISDNSESATHVRLVERDIESPEVFDVSDAGLWDGHPTLGGIWVAHPDLKEPLRVVIRNLETQKFVIGNLFRNDPKQGAPALRVSSDAAQALGIKAGDTTRLNVTALIRVSSATTTSSDGQTISPKPAIANATQSKSTVTIAKPYLQLGLFKIKANAMRAAKGLRESGTATDVKPYNRKGTMFWRVLTGPAQSTEQRKILLAMVRSKGFSDAYPVSK